ncbi:hypothetical protein O181_013957 [Austropuccinia psidii MF-1]|uniref:Integrase catalytic domain-containing protein n=1 Tax=Austropuccinia psidii MF-1 TaxID=1389203 RepID=A0A9Q3C0Q8_9BASI|nr:hypothetical protein [Austropuccinia psidii MF-1]
MDGFSNCSWIFFLQHKSEAKEIIKQHILNSECLSNCKTANIVSDNGSEFVNNELKAFFTAQGITHLCSAPYTPEQNSLAKRGNRTTIEKTRCLLKDSGLNLTYWAEAANTAVFLENRTPKRALAFESPFVKWYERKNNLLHIYPFGCLAIRLKQKIDSKFEEKGAEEIFLGYGEGHQTFRIMDRDSDDEESPPIPQIIENNKIPTMEENTRPMSRDSDDISFNSACLHVQPETGITEIELPKHKEYKWVPEKEISALNEIIGNVGDACNIIPGPRTRNHFPNYAGPVDPSPKTYEQAISGPDGKEWAEAVKTELENMVQHERKTNEDGLLNKYKAHLCVQGFSQKAGVDYTDVFSPTGCLALLRLLLALCHLNGFTVDQMDVRCAFLNGKPNTELYIKRPTGYLGHPGSECFRLNKSLYGLKKIPCCGNKALKETLGRIGLQPTNTNPCFFTSSSSIKPMWIFVHVDNLVFGGNWNQEFKTKIKKSFDMEDLGPVKYALVIRITQNNTGIQLIQDKLSAQIFSEFKIECPQPPSSPLPSSWKNFRENIGIPLSAIGG